MKKIYILAYVFIFGFSLAQVGINTDSPTKTFDVNGDIRVKILSSLSISNISYVITTDTNGNLSKVTPLNLMFSSGLFVKLIENNLWKNISIGNGTSIVNACDLIFSLFMQ